ncbi:MAG: hypothetical protein KJZ79_00310 [Bryobacteraceae bacterium]|nr:hypothetical protein [Bryobacteraceae bacterium]
MPELPLLEQALWIAQTILYGVLLARLISLGLAAQHRCLIAYLGLSMVGALLLMALQFNTNAYAYTWAGTVIVRSGLAALVVREIAAQVLVEYRGLSLLSRNSMVWVVVLCALGSLAAISYGFDFSGESFPFLRILLLFDQMMALTLMFCLVILLGFVLWFPMPLARNVQLYSFGFLIPLFATGVTVAVRMLGGPEWHRPMSGISTLVNIVCLGWWTICLRAGVESQASAAIIPRGPETERRLLGQLAELNQVLESRRKNI